MHTVEKFTLVKIKATFVHSHQQSTSVQLGGADYSETFHVKLFNRISLFIIYCKMSLLISNSCIT